MVRNWNIVRKILEVAEKDDLQRYCNEDRFLEEEISEEDFCGHIEILVEANILSGCDVQRNAMGDYAHFNLRGAFITMRGHDLLDSMRDNQVWTRVKARQGICVKTTLAPHYVLCFCLGLQPGFFILRRRCCAFF